MSTKDTPKKPFYKKVWFQALVAILLLIGLINALSGGDDDGDTTAQETTTTAETTVETAVETTAEPTPEGPDAQDWFDEAVYRPNNCTSQSIAYGGVALCEIRGTDMANDNTMLVGYVDQDREGVQEHFENEMRRTMFTQAFAERVMVDKLEGDPRLQNITHVRIIATGGEGVFSGWQDEAEVGS